MTAVCGEGILLPQQSVACNTALQLLVPGVWWDIQAGAYRCPPAQAVRAATTIRTHGGNTAGLEGYLPARPPRPQRPQPAAAAPDVLATPVTPTAAGARPAVSGLGGVPWAQLAEATTTPPGVTVQITGLRGTLMPHQPLAVAMLHATGALLNTDEQGLGKTLETLAAARLAGKEVARTVVVCPSGLVQNWVKEAEKYFDEGVFTPYVATGYTPRPIPGDADLVVVGWAVLHKWVAALCAWGPGLVAADEAHYAKGGWAADPAERTERGVAALQLCADALRRGAMVVALTGTPFPSRPVEGLALLGMVGALGAFGGRDAYLARYCDPRTTRSGETYHRGATNVPELRQRLLASGKYLRRTKQFLVEAGQLPRKYVNGVAHYYPGTPTPIIISGEPELRAKYVAAEEQFVGRLVREYLRTNPQATQEQAIRRARAQVGTDFTYLAKLRKLAAEMKVPYILRLVDAMVAQGEQVVIAAHHREIVDAYATHYTGIRIQGGMTVAKVERDKAKFNNGCAATHPVLVLSTEAAKTGHTLCLQEKPCARMVTAEEMWNPGDDLQVQDRIWRIGQTREVRIANVLAGGTVDIDMYQGRAAKRGVVDAITEGVTAEVESAAMDNVFARYAATHT